MVSVFNVKTYEPKPSDKFLFDTNILIFLYNSLNPDLDRDETKTKLYSDFMSKIINAKATIYLTSLNLAEFVNVLLTREYNIKKQIFGDTYSRKKDFRASEDYKYAISQIKPIVNNILKIFEKINDSFEELLIDEMVNNLKIDFNDEYYNYFCNFNNIKLLTDDLDYKFLNSPLEIVTANENYTFNN